MYVHVYMYIHTFIYNNSINISFKYTMYVYAYKLWLTLTYELNERQWQKNEILMLQNIKSCEMIHKFPLFNYWSFFQMIFLYHCMMIQHDLKVLSIEKKLFDMSHL